jgi:hypothetical protein
MSTSNSNNYSLTAGDLIEASFEDIGVAEGGEPLEPEDAKTALRALNIMLKALQKKLNIWKRKTVSIPLILNQYIYTIGQKSAGNATSLSANNLVDSGANFNTDNIQVGDTVKNITAGTSTTVSTVTSTTSLALASNIFTVGTEAYEITDADVSAPRPQMILECNRKNSSGNEITVNKLTRNEYENLPNKTTSGQPISYHYDPTINNGTFYIWQAPDASAVSDWTIELVYQSPIEDVDSTNDSIDVPSENYEALLLNLSYRLSRKFGGLSSTEKQILRADAKDALDLAEGYEQNQDGDVFVYPEIR